MKTITVPKILANLDYQSKSKKDGPYFVDLFNAHIGNTFIRYNCLNYEQGHKIFCEVCDYLIKNKGNPNYDWVFLVPDDDDYTPIEEFHYK